MDDREVVRLFLDNGLQINSMILDEIKKTGADPKTLINYLKGKNPGSPIIAPGDITGWLGSNPNNNAVTRKSSYSVNDFANSLMSRYNTIRDILADKSGLPNLMSINRMSDKIPNFSLICMVREKNADDTIFVEDTTGHIEMGLSGDAKEAVKSVQENDVIGLVCAYSSDIPMVQKIIWPDIPIKKTIATSIQEKTCLFLPPLSEEETVAIDSKLSVHGEKVLLYSGLGTPDRRTVSGVSMLLVHLPELQDYASSSGLDVPAAMTAMIKRRHLKPRLAVGADIFEPDPYLVSEVPDIVAFSGLAEQSVINYKGTTLVSTGDPRKTGEIIGVDLKTREDLRVRLI